MFRHLSYVLINICTLICFSQAATVNGTVTDKISGSALAGVEINIYDYDGNYDEYDTTGADGTYSFSDISSGEYTIDVTSSGKYLDVSVDTTIGNEPSVAIDFKLTKLVFSKLKGIITDKTTGKPISGVEIEGVQYSADIDNYGLYDTTGADGAYELDSVTSDEIMLNLTAPGYLDTIYDFQLTGKDTVINLSMEMDLITSVKANSNKSGLMNFFLSKNGNLTLKNNSESGMLKIFSLDGKQIFSYSFDRNCSSIALPQSIRARGTPVLAEIKSKNNKLTRTIFPFR